MSLIKYIFIEIRLLKLTKDHKGNNQSVKSNTFRHGDEDNGLTEQGTVLAEGAKSGACGACNGDTGAETGDTCYKGGADVAETGSETVSSCGVGSLYAGGAGEHYDRGYKDHAEKHEAVCGEGFFVALTVFLSKEKSSERYDNAENQCDSCYNLNDG